MKRLPGATLILLGLLALGCGSSTSPLLTADGNWQGTTGGQTLVITLTSTGQSVSGTGTVSATGSPSYALAITGTFVNPTLAVTMTSAQHAPISLGATLGGGVLAGSLNGGGFTDATIVLNKQ